MARSFADLASRAKESWSGDAHQVNEAASKVFKAEVSAQEALGADLADARHGRNITQKVLSDLSGVPQSEISRIESGRANPTIETVARLAAALDKKLVLQ
ncbi:helix-turn-helix domain-containing protein [Raineyella fluvialis]|uniref:Helix-turn-helix domain-containing protein n=1 Tax=Raineyella fluvialis TaxID=2662261 RepID=A0A5Q2FAS0_9ACTN|nr:helix-turn-helix transcriptional regulator [Raineyella fluvialis]QGF23481.1 helix-turn-helix domain-containing protein [Raineyella fluvialis]